MGKGYITSVETIAPGFRCTGLVRRKGVEVMDISDLIIKISIIGVLALAVLGTLQNIIGGFKKEEGEDSHH
jgi:hypothetical protein